MAVITKSVLSSTTDDTAVFDLPDEFAQKFDALSEARYHRMEWEKKEKALKKEILDSLPERQKGVKFVLRVLGVIRASVRQDRKVTVNAKELLAAFPEAYEALAKESVYDVVNPA